MLEKEDMMIPTMLAPEDVLSTVPTQLAELLDHLYSMDKGLKDEELVFMLFGECAEEEEAEFMLAFAYSVALEKKLRQPGRTDDDYQRAFEEIQRAERLEKALGDPLATDGLKAFVNDFFRKPENLLRIRLLSLRGASPIY